MPKAIANPTAAAASPIVSCGRSQRLRVLSCHGSGLPLASRSRRPALTRSGNPNSSSTCGLSRQKRSKSVALTKLSDTSATKVTLPFVEEQLRAARKLMGEDFWSYGLEPNREVLRRFLERHHAEGLSSRQLAPEELFHPASLELHKI